MPKKGQSDTALWRQVEGRVSERSPEGPIDRPLGERLGELLVDALPLPLGLAPGDRVGAHEIDALLGVGGMGTVFLARRVDGNFERRVALEILHRNPLDEGARRRFLRERQILAGLAHPHIARLLDGGTLGEGGAEAGGLGGLPYLVMEYVDGRPLFEDCEQRGADRGERIRLFLQACDAIHYAHRRGIVHRDLEPSNLLVEEGPDGEPRLVVLDFGIASTRASTRP